MDEQQLRSRSRSKTPFLRSQCDHEECEFLETGEHIHKVKRSPVTKNPTVTAITEESEIISSPITVKSSSQRSTRQTKTVTSDYSSAEEISPETSLKMTTAITSPAVVTKTTVITSTRKTITNNSENGGQKSVQLKEIGQNELNQAFEKIQKHRTSTPNHTKRRISTSVNTTLIDNADLSKHLPFKEYKEAGTYWNKYPKTDYTYSKLSPHRREIAPGVVAMPNMSRQSLDKHHERVDYMATSNPERESEIRARYQTTRHIRSAYVPPRPEIHYDSQDEVDLSEFERCHVKKYYTTTTTSTVKKEIWIKRVFTSIFISIFTTFYWMTDIFRSKDDETLYYTRYEEEQGFFGRFFSSIKNGVLAVFRRFYIFISSVLYLDSWLLQSSSKLEEGRSKKRFLLLLLILLPLLLLGAWFLCEESQRTELLSTLPLTSSLSLSALTSYIPSWSRSSSKFNFNFDFNWNPFTSSSQYNKIENIKSSLSEEEYNNLLNHIKIHVENVVAAKEKNQKVSNEIVILISKIVNENLIKFNYILTDADVERIAEIVRVKIGDVKTEVPFVLNKENFDEIKKVVSENMAVYSTDYTVNNNFNFDEIFFKILSSEKLVDFIDGRIDGKLKLLPNPTGDILSLNEEIKELKLKLEAFLGKGKDFDAALGLLKNNQAGFNDLFENYKIENSQRLENIVNEINVKINSGQEKQFVAINDQIREVLMELMGYKEEDLGDVALKDWVQSLFVAKSDLEARLLEIHGNINSNMEIEFGRSAGILMKTISENLKKEILVHLEKQRDLEGGSVKVSGNLNDEHIKKIVAAALAVYDADKTGLVDYALESAGGQILSTRCTESYQTKSAQISVFGIPLWYPTNTPRVAISPSVQPGNCWAFQGFPGFLVLQLNTPIHVTGFTMEHIPISLAPNGKIDSAPKLFSVWGLLAENDQDSFLFGKYEYLDNTTSLQYFPVQNRENLAITYQIVELRVESNHGNEHYSCLYRFRIHGTPNA